MRRTVILISLLFTFTANAVVVKGRITIIDEQHQPYQKPLNGQINVHLYERETNNADIPCGDTPVDNTSHAILPIPLNSQCSVHKVLAELRFSHPPAGWEQSPRPTSIAHCTGKECGLEIKVMRPRNPAAQLRSANFDLGAALLANADTHDDAVALFLLEEASTGDDTEYTKKAVSMLTKEKRYAEAVALLNMKDLDGPNLLADERFQLYAAKGQAAHLANDLNTALRSFTKALQVYPHSEDVPSYAVFATAQTLDARTPTELAEKLEKQPTVAASFERLLATSPRTYAFKLKGPGGKIDPNRLALALAQATADEKTMYSLH